MMLRPLASVLRATLILALPAVLAASCGGKVLVEDPSEDCENGLTRCADECVDLSSDWANCGACGLPCYEGGCFDGSCTYADCPPSFVDCFGSCVDPAYDPSNCGGCGLTCDSGICDLGSCVTGECLCGSLCSIISLGSTVPQSLVESTDKLFDQWVTNCAAGSGPDLVYSFFAPLDGVYLFDTYGSSIAPVLELTGAACGIQACSPTSPDGGLVLGLDMFAGQQVLVVLDTLGQQGTIQLNITTDGPIGPCATCSDVLTTGDPGSGFCPGSEDLYNAIAECICVGACGMACVELCNGNDFTMECEQCVYDNVAGCGNELDACLNDV
jgi:hypothetical protein